MSSLSININSVRLYLMTVQICHTVGYVTTVFAFALYALGLRFLYPSGVYDNTDMCYWLWSLILLWVAIYGMLRPAGCRESYIF